MNSKAGFIIVSITLSLLTTGCGWWNTAFRSFNVDDGTGAMVDIKQRAIIVSKKTRTSGEGKDAQTTKRTIVCAEPSPDAMSAYAAEVAGKINAYGKVNAELAGAFQESAAYTGLRTQSIQLLRDGFYRLCEGYMSEALDEARYDTLMRRYQRYMVALLGIEQLTGAIRVPPMVINTEGRAETAASISTMRKETEKIEQELTEKRKEKADLEGEISKLADADPNKKKLQQQVAALSTQITNRETDLARINKSIENAHGSIASGSASAIVSAPPNLNERSDAHIQAVAEVVGSIVTDILDTDDTGQLCWAYITTKKEGARDENVFKACLDYVNSNTTTKIKAINLLESKTNTQLRELQALPVTEAGRARREVLEKQVTNSIRDIVKGGHVGMTEKK